MSSASGVAAVQGAMTQAQVQSAVSIRVLKMSQEAGQQMADLVQQATETVVQTMATNGAAGRRLDLYA